MTDIRWGPKLRMKRTFGSASFSGLPVGSFQDPKGPSGRIFLEEERLRVEFDDAPGFFYQVEIKDIVNAVAKDRRKGER